jgi:hypothetical protein
MTQRTIRELVTEWDQVMTTLDDAWKSWRDLGVNIEAPFPDAVWRMASKHTEITEYILEREYGLAMNAPNSGWLSWFRWERPRVAGIKIDGKEFKIKTLDDLIEMLECICSKEDA